MSKNPEYQFLKESILEYLKTNTGEYALLLSGKWGSGKTYLMREIVKEFNAEDQKSFSFFRKPKRKAIAQIISLNGISSLEMLKSRILCTYMPQKYSKHIINIVSLASSITDIANFISVSKIGDCFLKNDWSNKLAGPLICDDIERCQIDGKELFGFLQTYQESIKQPIVIIGDEDHFPEIFNLTPKEYAGIKEKTIGRSLVKHANIEETISHFLKTLKEQINDELYSLLTVACVEIFNNVKNIPDDDNKVYENMRAFQIAIREAFFYYTYLNEEYKNNVAFCCNFLKIAIALQYAVQVGRFTKENWDKHIADPSQTNRDKYFRDTIVEAYLKSLGIHSFAFIQQYPILKLDMWKCLLFGDCINWSEVNEFIASNNDEFKGASRKSFEKLKFSWLLTKDEIEEYVGELNQDLAREIFTKIDDIFMAYSIKAGIFFVRERVYGTNINNELDYLRNVFITYINKKLNEGVLEIEDEFRSSLYGRLGDDYNVKKLFPNLSDVLNEIDVRYLENKRKQELHKALEDIQIGNIDPFCVLLMKTYSQKVVFGKEPITPKQFVSTLQSLEPSKIHELRDALSERYRFRVSNWIDFFGWCLPEKEAFVRIKAMLNEEIDKLKHYDIYRADNYMDLRDTIQQILERMDEYQKEHSMKVSQH